MRLNVRPYRAPVSTHEGGPAVANLSAVLQLRRAVLACLLWEDQFYEGGQTIADRISDLAEKVHPYELAELAIEARRDHNLRHVPLLLLEVLSRRLPGLLPVTMAEVIQRADEMGESLAVIFERQDGQKRKVPHAWMKGIRRVLPRFNEYQLAKYDRDGAIKLRDVLRLARPKPKDDEQAALWGRVIKRELAVPDTWEVALTLGQDKRETFERLLRERKLGYLALLRNLRNMAAAGVDSELVAEAIVARKGGAERVLPFRFVAAARAAPQYEPYLDQALCQTISELPLLSGKTIVLIDVSDSMNIGLSKRSDMTRMDAAATLGAIVTGQLRLFTFSDSCVEVPPRRGMAGIEAIVKSQEHSGTYLGQAIEQMNAFAMSGYNRLIVVTDEQSADKVPLPLAKQAYMINVASYQNGVGYHNGWTHIDGFSESVLRYIHAIEDHREGQETD